MGFSGTVSIWAMKDNDYQATNYPGTSAGLQSAIDSLAGGKGIVQVGPGELLATTAIWVHTGTHLRGSGRGKTVIKRATGSIADADAANSGAVIASSAYGANGTLSNSGATVSDIEISEISIDGNSSNFLALTSGTPHQAGILIQSCDGLHIHGVAVQNTLRSGYMLMESKNVVLTDVVADTVGQASAFVATRNAFDFYNYNNATSGYGVNFVLQGFRAYNVGDEVISLTNVSQVSVSNGIVDGCDMVFEIQGSTNTASDKNVSMTNVTATNILAEAVLISSVAGHGWQDVEISKCVFEGHATLHNARMIGLEAGLANSLSGVRISECQFRNINTLDTTTRNWIDATSNTGATYGNITIEDCDFFGLAGSTRTADTAFNLFSKNAKDITVRNCHFKNVAGRGVRIHDMTAAAMRNIRIEAVTVDTCTSIGFQVAGETTSTTIQDVYLDRCIAKDTNTATGDSAFQIVCSNSSTAPSGVFLLNCLAYKTSGTTMQYGLDLNASTGSMDNIAVLGCDFTGVQTAPFRASTVTATNVHFTPRPGRGTDITSAATITIPTDGDVFHVTGSTNVTNGITVKAWDNGRAVKLIFDSTPTVSDTGTSVLNGDFVATANDVLTLTCDGTNWYEVARSTN